MHNDIPRNIAILHVEDDANDAMLLRRAFGMEQVSNPLHAVGDGEQAIAYLSGEGIYGDRASHPVPGLVLLDIKMPKVDGFGVLKWIRAHRALKALPVAFLTASYMPKDVALAYHLGVNSFIVKPYEFDKLREIARFLKEWVRHTMLPPTDESDWIALTSEDLEERRTQPNMRAA